MLMTFVASVLALGSIAQADRSPCSGTPKHFLAFTTPVKSGFVYGPVVPRNESWLVEAAGLGVALNPGESIQPNSEFMLELMEPIPEEGHTDSSDTVHCCWRVPLAKATNVYATPVVALNRPLVLRAGQRLAGRTNNPVMLGINGTYWRYPASCAASLVVR